MGSKPTIRTEYVNKYKEEGCPVHKLRLSRLVSCGVNLNIVVRILTRFGWERREHQHGLPHRNEGKPHPHLLMLQELKDNVPEIFKVYVLLCLRIGDG